MAYRAIGRIAGDKRAEDRDEVEYRTRAFGPDAQPLSPLVVNVSPHGLMARCEEGLQPGDRIHFTLPVVGVIVAEVRWIRSGRMGCQFERGIDLASYYEMLAAILRP